MNAVGKARAGAGGPTIEPVDVVEEKRRAKRRVTRRRKVRKGTRRHR